MDYGVPVKCIDCRFWRALYDAEAGICTELDRITNAEHSCPLAQRDLGDIHGDKIEDTISADRLR